MTKSLLLKLLQGANPARAVLKAPYTGEGRADAIRFPFVAMVGQVELKLALAFNLINPLIGGVLLIGPRGTGKTTAVRGLVDLLPMIQRSACPRGCTPEAAEGGGMDHVCPDCAVKLGRGEPLMAADRMRLVELSLNARLEDVVGGINERIALEQQKVRLERGILARADQNLLYVDEVNLLDDVIVNAILDAAAQGYYTVRRGPLAGAYRARLALIGSMNPEEGSLRPQIMDRFGLRVIVSGLREAQDRLAVFRRAQAFAIDPYEFVGLYAQATLSVAQEIAQARERLPAVKLTPEAEQVALELVNRLQIDSHRAEIVLLQSARARAAADERDTANANDVATLAPTALRLRKSPFINAYIQAREEEDAGIRHVLDSMDLSAGQEAAQE